MIIKNNKAICESNFKIIIPKTIIHFGAQRGQKNIKHDILVLVLFFLFSFFFFFFFKFRDAMCYGERLITWIWAASPSVLKCQTSPSVLKCQVFLKLA